MHIKNKAESTEKSRPEISDPICGMPCIIFLIINKTGRNSDIKTYFVSSCLVLQQHYPKLFNCLCITCSIIYLLNFAAANSTRKPFFENCNAYNFNCFNKYVRQRMPSRYWQEKCCRKLYDKESIYTAFIGTALNY